MHNLIDPIRINWLLDMEFFDRLSKVDGYGSANFAFKSERKAL